MPASITLSNLTFATPDGQTLFKNLNTVFGSGRTGLVGRNGVGKTTLMKLIAGRLHPTSGAVAVSGTLALLEQHVSAGPGETIAGLFGIGEMLAAVRRAEKGNALADELGGIDWSAEERALAALSRTGIDRALDTPLSHLSGGEVTRARLAALDFSRPDFILLDEPTNNLDEVGRAALYAFLQNWRRGAVVISHDRTLLEGMDAIAELSSHGLKRFGGNFNFYEAEREAERLASEHALRDAKTDVAQTARTVRERSERKARHDAMGRRLRARRDQPKMVLDRMKAGAEASAGRSRVTSERQTAEAGARLDAARSRFEIVAPLRMEIASCGLALPRRVLTAEGLSGGYLPAAPLFRDLSFEMIGPEQLALTGGNGAGKSTAVALLAGRMAPLAGRAEIFVRYTVFDQAVSLLDPCATVYDNFRRLNPDDDDNSCRAALARFRFRAKAASQKVSALSGGERLRAGLAATLGGAHPVELLILDEPTNHLDLESLAMLEEGLTAFDGALLVISHDRAFRQRIGVEREIAIG